MLLVSPEKDVSSSVSAHEECIPLALTNPAISDSGFFHHSVVNVATTFSVPFGVLGQRLFPGRSDFHPVAASDTLYTAALIWVPLLSFRMSFTAIRYRFSARILRSETVFSTLARLCRPVACAIIEKSAANLSTTLRMSATVKVVVWVPVEAILVTVDGE